MAPARDTYVSNYLAHGHLATSQLVIALFRELAGEGLELLLLVR